MTRVGSSIEYRRLRAPRQDRGVLIEPAIDEVGAVLAANVEAQQASSCHIGDRCIRELAQGARAAVITSAEQYTSSYRDLPERSATASQRVFMAGHQPQLFHAGVWFKNFVLDRLARKYDGVAINLVIDNDTVKTSSIRVPGGSVERPTAAAVAFDAAADPIPFEERGVQDWATLESFATRATAELAPLVDEPIVGKFWPHVVARARETGRLGLALAQARHTLEGHWGSRTLEVPLSAVIETDAFWWLTAHLLSELPRLHDVYDDTVLAYRRANHIRSANHPVPLLAQVGDWLEAPLWLWTETNPRRRHLFVRRVGGELELGDRDEVAVRVPLGRDGDWSATAAALAELGQQGIKIRPRALVTTLFARLFLCDMFMHGIGGSKYDELTDALLREFFGVVPPTYATVSATVQLPIKRPQVTSDDWLKTIDNLRQLTYHPDRFVDAQAISDTSSAEEMRVLVEEKRHWVAITPTRKNARTRCRAIRAANEALQPWVANERQLLLKRREQLATALRAETILGSRDHAFCLFPEKDLRGFMVEFPG